MRLIRQEVIMWGVCPTDWQASIERIERAGRVCWASEPKGDALEFVQNIWNRGHNSVLEHSNVVLRSRSDAAMGVSEAKEIFDSPYLYVKRLQGRVYVCGNWRAFLEWGLGRAHTITNLKHFPECLEHDLFELITEDSEVPQELKRYTVELLTDRAVLAEITRHRNDTAFSVRSQRYCDESNLVIVEPSWFADARNDQQQIFINAMKYVEVDYRRLLRSGLSRQHARVVLPNQTATRIVMTAYPEQWEWIFKLRTANSAYPQIRELMSEIQKQATERGLV